ncbi:Protein of unknown function, partial [Gryllus bimaculatus]
RRRGELPDGRAQARRRAPLPHPAPAGLRRGALLLLVHLPQRVRRRRRRGRAGPAGQPDARALRAGGAAARRPR